MISSSARYLLCLLLAGCATQDADLALKVLGNLEHCDRHYTLGLGVGASGSLVIDCKARPYEVMP